MSILLRLILLLPLFSVAAGDAWIKVNSGNALQTGSLTGSVHGGYARPGIVSVAKTGRGNIHYVMQDNVRGMVLGRFNAATKSWELLSDGTWSATAIPTSVTNTLAQVNRMTLCANPDNPDGLLGISAWDYSLLYGTQGLDVHNNTSAVRFDGAQWTQWDRGTNYSRYYMRGLTPYWWRSNGGAFAFDPASRTGIHLGAVVFNDPRANDPQPKHPLTACLYQPNDSAMTWRYWGQTSWHTDTWYYHYIIDTEHSAPLAIASLGGGNFLAVVQRSRNPAVSNICAIRYLAPTVNNPPTWQVWNGNGWVDRTNYVTDGSAAALFSPVTTERSPNVQLVATSAGAASLLYVTEAGALKEIRYSGGTFGSTTTLDTIGSNLSYTTTLATDGTLWLYYPGPNYELRLKKKPAAGNWSSAEIILPAPATGSNVNSRKVNGASFVGTDRPMLFMTEIVGFNSAFAAYAIAPPDSLYWSGEQGMAMYQPPVSQMPDPMQFTLTRQFTQDHNWGSGALAVDQAGYVYLPEPGTWDLTVVQNDWIGTRFWDYHGIHINFPTGVAVDNRRGKVYVASDLVIPDTIGVTRSGSVDIFDLEMRTQNLSGGSWYKPQKFGEGSFSFTADVSVDETRGRLYVTSSSFNRIDVYDIANLTRATGDAANFARALLEGSAASTMVIDELVSQGALAWVVSKTDGRLRWLTDDINGTIDYAGAACEALNMPIAQASQLLHDLQDEYKVRCDLPVFLRSIGTEGVGNGQFSFPQCTDVDSLGNVYVADTLNHRIQKFDANGNFVKSWGRLGTGNGEFIYPHGIAADPRFNLIYVTDPTARRVQVFDRDGNFLTGWNSTLLVGVTADGAGHVYFTGTGSVVNQNPRFVYEWTIVDAAIDLDSNGIPDSLQDAVVPNTPPVAVPTVTPVSDTHPTDLVFNSAGSHDADNDPIVAWEWTLAGQQTPLSTASTAVLHVAIAADASTMYLRVQDSRGAWSNAVALPFTVPNHAPTVKIQASRTTGPAPLTVDFTSNGTADADAVDKLTYTWSMSGVRYGTPVCQHTFTAEGIYAVLLTVADGFTTATEEIQINVTAPNQPPVVNAGSDQSIRLPDAVSLAGSASDDGIPNPLTTLWTKISGPGQVTFTDASALATKATFSGAGTYVLRLTASDGAVSQSDDVTVVVKLRLHPGVPTTGNAEPLPVENAPTLNPFSMLRGSVIHDKNGRAVVTLSGAVPELPAAMEGLTANVGVGNYRADFILDKRGRAANGGNSFTLRRGKKNRVSVAMFSARFEQPALGEFFSQPLAVIVTLGGVNHGQTVNPTGSAKKLTFK